MWTELDPRLRGGDDKGNFRFLGRAAGPWVLTQIRIHHSECVIYHLLFTISLKGFATQWAEYRRYDSS